MADSNCTWYKEGGPVRGAIRNFVSSPYGGARFFVTVEETHNGKVGLCHYAGVPSFMLEPDDNVKTVTNLMRDIVDVTLTTVKHSVSDFEWYNPDVWKREMGLM